MATVYLIPSLLHEEGVMLFPLILLMRCKKLPGIFCRNERTARRYLKQLWKLLGRK
jgi:16S rRNA (cytidine1402-2'-O)-methyltransferase